MSSGSGALSCSAAPTACAIRPQFGSPPLQRGLDERRVGDRARRARHGRLVPAVDDDAADPARALAVAHHQEREPAQQHVERLAEAQLVLGLGRDPHAARARRHQDRRVVGGELPVDRDAVERALDADAEQQVGGLRRQRRRRSGRSTASSRTRARSSPRPWPARRSRTVPDGSATSSVARLGKRSVVRDRLGERLVAVGGELARARPPMPRMIFSVSSGTPITPVDAIATRSSGTPATIAPAPCIRAASSSPRRPVAALALPELATTARMRGQLGSAPA